MDEEIKKLYDLALKVRQNSYSPITNFKVGATVETVSGTIYTGCNVESITFNNSTHAEMNAIDNAISNEAKKIRRILVVTQSEKPVFPCALCRQKIIEFGAGAEVIATNLSEEVDVKKIEDLYPYAFVSI